jgi:hypothetical protein
MTARRHPLNQGVLLVLAMTLVSFESVARLQYPAEIPNRRYRCCHAP